MEANLSPVDIAKWYRSKAQEYIQRALDVEKDFNVSGVSRENRPVVAQSTLSLESIMSLIRRVGAKRPADLAKELGSNKAEVMDLISKNSLFFEKTKKGWYKLKEDSPQ